MTVAASFALLALAGVVYFVGGCNAALEPLPCEPSGTFVQSDGLRVRVHSANLCEGRGPGR